MELYLNGVIVDIFGDPNVDGTGEPWEHLDGWAYRVDGTGPDPTFVLTNWIYSGVDALDGTATNDAADNPFPLGTYTETPSQLIITGVVDGPLPGGLPKALELYAIGDIANLSAYGVDSVNNGGGSTGGPTFLLNGTASAGQFMYVATEGENFIDFFGFAPDFIDNVSRLYSG